MDRFATRSLPLPVLTPLRQTNIATTAHRDVQRWTCATGICQRIRKAHFFDETFGVNSAFNAEVFVAAPHAVAMEFDLFGKRRSSHWVKGGGVASFLDFPLASNWPLLA